MIITLSSELTVFPVLSSITLQLEPNIQNMYDPHELKHTFPPVYWVSLSFSTSKLLNFK